MELFVYHITGLSPILQHNPRSMTYNAAGSGLAGKKVYVAEQEAEAGTYRDEEGRLVVPTIAFRASILKAAGGRKIGKATARSVLAGSVFPAEQYALLLSQATEKPLTDYKVHTCRAVINKKAGIIRARPMIENWCCDLALEIDTEMIPNVEIVTQILNIAGKIVGVMDWRPEKLGIYGRFSAAIKGAEAEKAPKLLRNPRKIDR